MCQSRSLGGVFGGLYQLLTPWNTLLFCQNRIGSVGVTAWFRVLKTSCTPGVIVPEIQLQIERNPYMSRNA